MSNQGMPAVRRSAPAAHFAEPPQPEAAAPGTVTPPAAGGRDYAGQSAQDRTAARRARLIEAGIRVFGQQGFRSATVRGLCSAAGLTDRYFYESFDNLEALLLAVHATLMAGLRERLLADPLLRQARAGAPVPADAASTAGYEIWFELVSDPGVARIVLNEVLGVSPAVDAQYEAGMHEFAAITTAPMVAQLPTKQLDDTLRLLIGRALVGAALHVARLWLHSGYAQPRAAVVRSCVLVATGTLAALAGHPSGD